MGIQTFTLLFFFLLQFVVAFSLPSECQPSLCGGLGKISFPYRNTSQPEECGPFEVKDCDELRQKIRLENGTQKWYEIHSINQEANEMVVTDTELQQKLNSSPCDSFYNFNFSNLPFPSFFQIMFEKLTLLRCHPSANVTNYITSSQFEFNYTGCQKSHNFNIYYSSRNNELLTGYPPGCTAVELPGSPSNFDGDSFPSLEATFTLRALVSEECYGCYIAREGCDHVKSAYCFEQKRECSPFNCEALGSTEITFPFTSTTQPPSCGPFVVEGCNEGRATLRLGRGTETKYEVHSIFQSVGISVTDTQFQSELASRSCDSFDGLYLPNESYASTQLLSSNIKLLKCPPFVNVSSLFEHNYTGCGNKFIIHYNYPSRNTSSRDYPPDCTLLQLPINTNNSPFVDFFRLFNATFFIRAHASPDWWWECYLCHIGGGNCGPICDKPPESKKNPKLKRAPAALPIAAPVAAFVAGVICVTIYYFKRRFNKTLQDHESIEAFLRSHGSVAPKRYRYSQVKKMTRGFSEKLGQGGYGSVFKGELADGRLVAVKVLKGSKSNGEEFINEVASISRTAHVNVVPLFGFCFEGSKRALIYEFMANGSLEKYIYEYSASNGDRRLGWETLQQIAVGIAEGLEYLHRGCNTRILHFDIKPHNILLDEGFCPKISDFGLAKICPKKESTVSLLGARGTAGYIAPEVFCRSIGGVSHKSDVYSYGMLLFEMVGGRKNICTEVDHSSEIYFPHWIFNRLERGEELGVGGINNDEENKIARKMILVSLWCIQTDPSNRPPMCKVVEMLEGNLDSLQIAPKPYLSSPSRSPPS